MDFSTNEFFPQKPEPSVVSTGNLMIFRGPLKVAFWVKVAFSRNLSRSCSIGGERESSSRKESSLEVTFQGLLTFMGRFL